MNRRSINLLTWRFRCYLLVRARLLQWSAVWAACTVITVAWWQLENCRLGLSQDAMAIMENRCEPLHQMQKQNRVLAERASQLMSHESLLARLDDERVPYRLLGLVSRTVSDCLAALEVQSLTFERRLEAEPVAAAKPDVKSAAPTAATQQPALREVATLTLNGMADDNIAVSRFVGLLRDSRVFQSVELVSSVGGSGGVRRAQVFLVKCVL